MNKYFSINNHPLTAKIFSRTVLAQKGSSTLELLIAFAVVTLALTAVVMVVYGNQSMTIDAELGQQALNQAKQHLEEAIATSTANFVNFNTIDPLPLAPGEFFSTTTVVTEITPCIKKIDSEVSYNAEGRPQKTIIGTIVTSLEEFFDSGSNCDTDPNINDWDNPESLGYADFSPGGIEATDIDVIKRGNERFAILTAHKPPSNINEEFWVFDVTNPTPIFKSKLDFGGEGALAVYVANNYAYTAYASSTGQVVVVDISDPTNPSVSSRLELPGIAGTCPNGCFPRSIYFYRDRVYVGTNYLGIGAGDEFHVYSTEAPYSPGNPGHIGSLNINHNVNDIVVKDNLAYLATSDEAGELMIVDISNPSAMIHPDISGMKFDAKKDDGSPSAEDGNRLYSSGNTVYLGRTQNLPQSSPDFFILDVRTPNNISKISSKELSLSNNSAV